MQPQDQIPTPQKNSDTTNHVLLACFGMLGSVVFFVFVVPNIIFFGAIALMALFAGG